MLPLGKCMLHLREEIIKKELETIRMRDGKISCAITPDGIKHRRCNGLLGAETVRVDSVSFLNFLDLPLLMVDTWSSTRWCPERSLPSEGTASEVSSAAKLVIADFSGSAALILPKLGTLLSRSSQSCTFLCF